MALGPRREVPRSRWLFIGLVFFNLALFLPGYLFQDTRPSFWPFFPKEHPHGAYGFDLRSVVEYLKALFIRRANLDIFRVSFEFVLMLGVTTLAAGTRLRTVVRLCCVALYAFLAVFLSYQYAFEQFTHRPPALVEDWRLLLNLLHFLEDGASSEILRLVAAVAVGSLVLLVLLWRFFGAFERWVSQGTSAARGLLSVACMGWCAGSVIWFGVERDDPVVRLHFRRVFDNVAASMDRLADQGALASTPADRRYDVMNQVKLTRRPNVYLLMVEAYGEVLNACDFAPAYQSLMARVGEQLGAKGFHAASAYSEAPVRGGLSWFSIATVETGMRIDRHHTYNFLQNVGAHIPTITSFFRDQGYETLALQPALIERVGLNRFDLYGHRTVIGGNDLEYHGVSWGFGTVPDQYSVGFFKERVLAKATPPYFMFFMSVSTHYNWPTPLPFVADWRVLGRPESGWDTPGQPRPEIAHAEEIGADIRKAYFRNVAYEWRVLMDLIESDPTDDAVFLVVGDHQPKMFCEPWDKSANTPVHVISKDAALVQSFESAGFQPGPYAAAGAGQVLKHEGLFSLLVSRLAAGRSTMPEGVAPPAYFPDGIGHGGLMR